MNNKPEEVDYRIFAAVAKTKVRVTVGFKFYKKVSKLKIFSF